LRGEQLSEDELRQLGQITGLNRMDDLRYRDWMARRMQKAMQFDSVREAMREMMELMSQMGMSRERLEQIRSLIQANQEALEDQIDQYVGRRIAENKSERPPMGSDLDDLLGSSLWPSFG
jgi:hypothetical protein